VIIITCDLSSSVYDLGFLIRGSRGLKLGAWAQNLGGWGLRVDSRGLGVEV
jgi:hypothetical protein